MTSALALLLSATLGGCVCLTLLVVGRKRRRDRVESRFAARRALVSQALLTKDADGTRARLSEAVSDPDAQVDLAVALEAIWPELDGATIAFLHEIASSIGLAGALGRAMRSRSPTVRGRAVLVLSRLRLPGATSLIAPLLRDPDADVRLTAAGALATIADEAAAHALIDALASESLPAERVVERLGFGWAVGGLLDALALEHASAEPRIVHGRPLAAHLMFALGQARDPRAEPGLIGFLASGGVEERVAATRALGMAGTRGALPPLLHALNDEEWTVRAQAARSLGALKATDAIPALEAALSDPAWWVRSNSATALRLLGEPGLAALRRALGSGDRYARDRAREALDLAAVTEGRAG
ncbi:MAG: HEAT repeat domain-containing protein [Actinomycetota bacterium]